MNINKNSSLLALLLFHLSTFSQNEYFANNPKWGISEPCQFSPFEPEWGKKTTFYINGDTLLNEEVFVKIFQEGFTYYGTGTSSYTETPYINPLPLAFLRSEEMKMFKWNEELNIKELLYDFDVTVGDTFNTSVYSNPLTVIAISTITLGGFERKVITATEGSEGSYESEYIEGVGHWRGIWYPNEAQLDCQSYLTCFSLDDESYVVDQDEYPWLIPSSDVCEYFVGIDETTLQEIYIYPNPASNELTVVGNSQISLLVISDPTGRIVFASTPYAAQAMINISALSTGCYFFSTTNENGIVKTMKFLKD